MEFVLLNMKCILGFLFLLINFDLGSLCSIRDVPSSIGRCIQLSEVNTEVGACVSFTTIFFPIFTRIPIICTIIEIVISNNVYDADKPDGKSFDVHSCIMEPDDLFEGPSLILGFGCLLVNSWQTM
jgi:hypothetical protein